MKDPVLLSYSLEELMYEFQSVKEHKKAQIEQAEQETDKIEEEKEQANEDWVAQLEAEEAAAEAEAAARIKADPSKDPANIKWMEEQIALSKEQLGEDFGEDLSLDFNQPIKTEE
jgi:peptidoglycan hydrolase CwlO-like protein